MCLYYEDMQQKFNTYIDSINIYLQDLFELLEGVGITILFIGISTAV